MNAKPAPVPDAITQAYWERLREGRLSFQLCGSCQTPWLPASPICPRCWSAAHQTVDSSGRARLVTWVTYHRAYHPAFSDRIPYVVGLVELEEGPRLMAGIQTDDPESLRVGARLELAVESREGGYRVPEFAPGSGEREDENAD